MQDIADLFGCSLNKIKYWIDRHRIKTRSISAAIYLLNNPGGDPFTLIRPKTLEQARLLGIGIGLYWGEGNKANKTSVRLGNTDPKLIKTFMEFLIKIFRVKKKDFRFNLQVFTDINTNLAIRFWMKELGVRRDQFTKTTITKSGSLGTYRKKSQYGVLTVNYHNKKLRDLLVSMLPL